MADSHFAQNDRDLLITIKTQLDRAVLDIKNIHEKMDIREKGFASKEDTLEIVKLVENIRRDHESRLRWLERIAYGGLALLASLQFYFNYLQ